MAIKEKDRYTVYLDKENADFVRAFLNDAKIKGGLSGLMDGYLQTMAITLRASGYKPGSSLSYAQVIKFGLKGLTQSPA